MRRTLPIATGEQTRAYARSLMRRHPRPARRALSLHAVAAVAGLAGPRLLGGLVQGVQDGTTTTHVDHVALLLAGFVLAQTLLTRYARRASSVLGEQVLADLREEFLSQVLALPLSTGGARRDGRPAHPYDRRRRRAVAHGPLRGARDADRARHDVPDRCRDVPGVAGRRAAGAGVRAAHLRADAVVPEAGAGGLPRRARRVLGDDRGGRRERRGRAHGRGAAACRGCGSKPPTPRWPPPTRPSDTRCGCAASGSRPSTSPTWCR